MGSNEDSKDTYPPKSSAEILFIRCPKMGCSAKPARALPGNKVKTIVGTDHAKNYCLYTLIRCRGLGRGANRQTQKIPDTKSRR